MEDHSIRILEKDGLSLKYRIPEGVGPHPVVLMLHGWTGDENSMWIFESKLPPGSLIIVPRGLFESPIGGYSWYPKETRIWPSLSDFKTAADALAGLQYWKLFSNGDFQRLKMVGFSQGAALAYSYALERLGSVQAIAGLSGFVPEGVEIAAAGKPMKGLPIFVAHGSKDKIVPVERAREGNKALQQAGAQVSYCEDDVGHKLSAGCYRGMQEFFRRICS